MNQLRDRIQESADFLRENGVESPRCAFVLGSGLSDVLPLENAKEFAFADIPHFPQGSVVGHSHQLAFGTVENVPAVVLRGRVHLYEGVELVQATFPIRVLRELGCAWVGLTNASGGIRHSYEVGDVVLVTDHLNMMGDNPLIGPNDDSLGPRFPDMSTAYDAALRATAVKVAAQANISLRQGVYAAVSGPHYETPTELRMLRALGADLVGMSTVPETIVAVHAGLKVLALSTVTDLAFPEEPEPLSHEAVVKAAAAAAPKVDAILRGVLRTHS